MNIQISERSLARRRLKNKLFTILCAACAALAVLTLFGVIWGAVNKGIGHFDWQFVTSPIKTSAARTGAWNAVVGSLWVLALTMTISIPLGITAAVFLEELVPKGRIKDLIQTNISNLAGVPSIIFGILGLALFVRGSGMGPSILAASLTMSLLVLPVVTLVTQEALRMVPKALREASLALGATKWQTILRQVLPSAAPNILTGVILAASRTLGESSPLFVIGAVTFGTQVPSGPGDRFTVLPIQIYNWSQQPEKAFEPVVAQGIILLMGIIITMNLAAIILRGRAAKHGP